MSSYYHQDRISNYIKNFPFPTLREKQSFVLNEIDAAFASGYNHIIVEAPTGFGKSPVGMATALTLGSSYILTSTKTAVRGYLIYTFFIVNTQDQTRHLIMVDAGNAKVLYTSQA